LLCNVLAPSLNAIFERGWAHLLRWKSTVLADRSRLPGAAAISWASHESHTIRVRLALHNIHTCSMYVYVYTVVYVCIFNVKVCLYTYINIYTRVFVGGYICKYTYLCCVCSICIWMYMCVFFT
jgi:hypothetical protein